jgi:hypothetical protein
MSTFDDLDLSQIPGLGPVRRQALAEVGIEDLQGLLRMKLEELAAVRGVGIWQARRIREFLRQRGILVEAEESGVLTVHSHSPAEAEAVAVAAAVLEEQAAHEAQVEAEVEMLADAVQEAEARQVRGGNEPEAPARLIMPETAPEDNGKKSRSGKRKDAPEPAAEAEQHPVEAGEPAAEAPELSVAQVRAQRERLPETAVALMEAIRAAAVSRRLTRQLTLFLIVAGEFTAEGRKVSPEQLARTRGAMEDVERELQRAVERERFSPRDQQDLADRIRKHRKALEKLLARVEAKG